MDSDGVAAPATVGDFMRLSVRERCREPEVMDDPALDRARHCQALSGLARVNCVSGSDRILWAAIKTHIKPGQPLKLLDVAAGAGDVPIALWRRAQRIDGKLQVTAADI